MEANDTNWEPPQIVPIAGDVPLWFPDLRSGIFDEKRRRRPIPITNIYYSLLLLWSWRWLLLLRRQPAVARIVPRYLTSKYYKTLQMLHGKNWWSRDWRVAWRVSGVSAMLQLAETDTLLIGFDPRRGYPPLPQQDGHLLVRTGRCVEICPRRTVPTECAGDYQHVRLDSVGATDGGSPPRSRWWQCGQRARQRPQPCWEFQFSFWWWWCQCLLFPVLLDLLQEQ